MASFHICSQREAFIKQDEELDLFNQLSSALHKGE